MKAAAAQDEGAMVPYRCRVVRTSADLAAITDDWRHLQEASRSDTLAFQTLPWVQTWTRIFAQHDHCQPCVLLVHDAAGTPLLLWPLMRERHPLHLTVISWLGDPYGQYGDVLTTLSGSRLHAALDVALAELRRQDADLVRLRHVRADAAIAPWLASRFLASSEDTAAPWLDLRQFADEEELQRRLTPRQRRHRRKMWRRLQRHLGVAPRLRMLTRPDEVHAAIDRILACKRRWLKAKGLFSRALFDDRVAPFLHALAEAMPPAAGDVRHPRLVISVLQAGRHQLAWELGLRWRRRHYAYITAHEPEVARFSVGRIHMDLAQRQALRDGVEIYDLLVPDTAHKRSFSTHRTPVRGHFLPLSLRGRLVGQLYLRHLRPLVREVYHRIPVEARRMLRLGHLAGHDDRHCRERTR